MIITTKNSKETRDLGKMLAQEIKNGQVVCLSGELGSGKTTFTQGFLQGLKIKGPYTSPTFVIMKHYKPKTQNPKPKTQSSTPKNLKKLRATGYELLGIYHIDAYRINAKDILNLGWEEIIADSNNIIIVEWAERIKKIIPQNSLWICMEWLNEKERKIIFKNK